MISPGSFIGNYRIISPLSSDAFSQLYLAENAHARGGPIAIRMWHGLHFTTVEQREVFLKEAQGLIQLRHPYIVSTLDAGLENDSPYIVSEYVYSTLGTLQERIQRQLPQPFLQHEALMILSQVGQALMYAHQQNILHRQLSPAAIVSNTRGEALLGDFALVTIQEAVRNIQVGPTRQSVKELFQPPEQQQGVLQKSKLGDQYSLGSIAYALLTGYLPSQPPIAPTQRNSFLPIFMERAILKAMSQQPIERFPSVEAFLVALSALPEEGTVVKKDYNAIPAPPTPILPLLSVPSPTPVPLAASPMPPIQEQFAFPPTADVHNGMGPMVLSGTGVVQAPDNRWAPTVPPMSPPNYGSPNNKNKGLDMRRIALIALIVVLLLLLIGGGAFAYTLIPAGSATVTLTPKSQSVGNTYSVYLVVGKADATQGQVTAHVISASAQPQTKTAQATGRRRQAATSATGTLTLSNTTAASTLAVGQKLTSNSGVEIVTDAEVQIPAGVTTTVAAHAVNTGANGNIPAYDVNNTYQIVDKNQQVVTTVLVQNTTAFSGGQDAGDVTFVQQSDLDGVVNPLVSQMTSDAQTSAQKQVGPNEKLVSDLKCAPVVNANHKVNDQANNVTVQVTVQCTGEAYVPQTLRDMAVTLLKADAAQKLGSNYAMIGNAVTGTPTPDNVDGKGTATFSVKANSIWAFQFSYSQKQQMARAIMGKTVADSNAILQRFEGVSKSSIQTGGFGGALPSSSQNITFTTTTIQGVRP